MDKKDKLIIENFARIFNKIKRLDEAEVNEIDYKKVYNSVGSHEDPMKGFPTASPHYIDNWIKNYEQNQNDSNYNYPPNYGTNLYKLKAIYNKVDNGQQLSDEEKKIYKYVMKSKDSQVGRIKKNAKDKLGKDFKNNFDGGEFKQYIGHKFPITIYDDETKQVEAELVGIDGLHLDNNDGIFKGTYNLDVFLKINNFKYKARLLQKGRTHLLWVKQHHHTYGKEFKFNDDKFHEFLQQTLGNYFDNLTKEE
jgi:hypothetical protein